MKSDFPPVVFNGDGEERDNYIKATVDSDEKNLNPLRNLFVERLKETMLKGIELSNNKL